MDEKEIMQAISQGVVSLGIEFGSTRIKAVLIDLNHTPIASGSHTWENSLEDGIWTYSLDAVWFGVRQAYAELAKEVKEKFALPLTKIEAIGISAMMHGYLPFDAQGKQLAPFRTWRNTITEDAANLLTKAFAFHIPQRWSIAHLYQAILNGEPHAENIAHLTTLSGYVHWRLTGRQVIGAGEASGMFPLNDHTGNYDETMLHTFNSLAAQKNMPWKLQDILPKALRAGENGGTLTEEGARLLDESGVLQPGALMCPPEGDAGTGMVATNSIAPRTGNISAGTSIFAMVVLEKSLEKVHTEIDLVTTPDGLPVAMVHCNTCTSDLDAWVRLFEDVMKGMGIAYTRDALYEAVYRAALAGDADCGGLLSYNYYGGEPIAGFDEGRPLFVRLPDSKLSLSNFSRSMLYSAMATLKIGMDILMQNEHVPIEKMMGHGGFFKTKGVGQQLMAGALNVPIEVMESAGEGGAWGIALLASFAKRRQANESLVDYLNHSVFGNLQSDCMHPQQTDIDGFSAYLQRYREGLPIEKAAIACLK